MSKGLVYVPIEGLNAAAGIGSATGGVNHQAQIVLLCGLTNGSVINPVQVSSDGKLITSGA